MEEYRDTALPPVGDDVTVLRRDGTVLTIKVTPAADFVIADNNITVPELAHPLAGRSAAGKTNPKVSDADELLKGSRIFDHDVIGGKFTVFVLLYGDFYQMHQMCLESVRNTVPAERMELRVGCVQLGEQSEAYVRGLLQQNVVTKAYWHTDNPGKYRVMREMFYDQDAPITTKWLLWLDDDTLCDRNHHWATLLCEKLINGWDSGVRLVGPKRYWQLRAPQLALIRAAANSEVTIDGKTYKLNWYKGKRFLDKHERPSPNHSMVPFPSGSFWAAHVESLYISEVPDPRLVHNGGDYWIGAQFLQNGFKFAGFSDQKQIINWSAWPRRGIRSNKHLGLA